MAMHRKTIMVVEPQAIIRELAEGVLRDHGYDVRGVCNGREAIELIKDRSPDFQCPDLIMLALDLPDMHGLEVIRALENTPNLPMVPVIICANAIDRSIVVEAARLGVGDFLIKRTFTLEELFRRIDRNLEEEKAELAENEAEAQNSAHRQKRETTSPADGSAPAPEPDESGDALLPLPAYDPHEDPADTLKRLKPVILRSEMKDRIDNCGDPKALSPTVAQVLKMTASANCSIEHVAGAIRRDQGIALKILKLANSSVYNRGEPIESMPKAVMRIGLGQIRQTVLNLSVIDAFSDTAQNEHLDSRLFWEHSIACGLISSELVQARDGSDDEVDTAFTVGLLHDVGRMVYADLLGPTYHHVLQAAAQLRLPLERVESRMLLINHADAMDRVLRRWRFPTDLIDPIALHHLSAANARSLAKRTLTEVATLCLANRLAHALMLGTSGNRTIYPIDDLMAVLKLAPGTIQRIVQEIPDQTNDMKFTLLSEAPQAEWPDPIQKLRERMGQPLRPIYASGRPDQDTFGIFCDQVKDEDPDASPNIAVARMTSPNECVPVSQMLAQAEQQAGVSNLPLIVISPKGTLQLQAGLIQNRPVRLLAEPLQVDRFAEAISALLTARSVNAAA